MYRSIIIDDEKLARTRMLELCSKHEDSIDVIAEASSGIQAIELINKHKPELIFLDIQMPDISGFDVLKQISCEPLIVFTTAYSQYAVEAFETLSIDYLVKPIEKERFKQTIEKLNKLNQSNQSNYVDITKLESILKQTNKKKEIESLALKKGDRIVFEELKNIVYFKSEDKYVNIVTNNKQTYLSDKPLHFYQEKLPDYFLRINRSTIINKEYIHSVEKYFKGTLIIYLINGEKVKSGETYSKEVKSKLGLL